ncbi:PEP/pyruvate-binding domain-containing protein [Nocardia sienata]|uniref:PEP/pyruvate-binding domain-containing protein n=1 Tax=Nocardia sienata TaxID=248552 RepID=UPI0007A3C75F|nr:PEP/pyruvate-binding domain-containing protein [Nocardia sienata]
MIHQLRDAVPETCGGKAGTLGALVRAGLLVPDGFVIPFDVYRAALANPTTTVTDVLRDAIAEGLARLGDRPVAVRSSADDEDTPAASAAGQHESVLAVQGVDSVMNAVQTCWTSLWSQRATAYRAALGGHERGSGHVAMAVLVQRLVDAEVSGVMFTPTGRCGNTAIEASWGLGPTVVGGAVTPDAYRVDGSGAVTENISDKRLRMDRDGAVLVTRDVSATDRGAATIDDETAVRLSRLGHTIASVLGGPQDVEWALEGDRIWILQARPITAGFPSPPPDESANNAAIGSPPSSTGTPGSPGTATGTARIVRGPGDFARVRPGDILVCPYTDPAWTPLLRIAKGVVTETGGVLSHAAIVAREMRIPAVLAVTGATDLIRDDTPVTIDGSAGTVTAVGI